MASGPAAEPHRRFAEARARHGAARAACERAGSGTVDLTAPALTFPKFSHLAGAEPRIRRFTNLQSPGGRPFSCDEDLSHRSSLARRADCLAISLDAIGPA